jgi:hypothetical protein
MRNPETPLSELEREAFDHVERLVSSTAGDVTYSETVSALEAREFLLSEARDVLEQLEMKGYVYVVDGVVRVT